MRLLVCSALIALLAAETASAQSIGQPGVSGGGGVQVFPIGGGPVGTVATATGVPAGTSCQWLRNGSNITGATTCASYTTVTADGGTTVALRITLAGVSITAGALSAQFFFPTGQDLILTAATM